jgi:hypothetical protein
MKDVVKGMQPLLLAAASFAQSNTVWHRTVGVITAPCENPKTSNGISEPVFAAAAKPTSSL